MPPSALESRFTITPPAAASTGVPSGAMMSIPRCRRPPERAAWKESRRSSRRTPATGIAIPRSSAFAAASASRGCTDITSTRPVKAR